jgi:hypothetical protein
MEQYHPLKPRKISAGLHGVTSNKIMTLKVSIFCQAQDRDQWRALVNTAMKLRVP